MGKLQAHTRYKNAAGHIVPGTTTVIGCLKDWNEIDNIAKWANGLGLQGIDSTAVRDEMGDAGKLTHSMILADLKGERYEAAEDEYGKDARDMAANSFLSYLKWKERHTLEPVIIEQPLVSEELQVGGCEDYLGLLDGVMVLIDWKTGYIAKKVYIQTCAYRGMAIECGYPAASEIIVLSIPRTEDEVFKEFRWVEFENGWEIFKLARGIYPRLGRIRL